MSDFDLSKITGTEPPLMTDDDKDAEIERLRSRLYALERGGLCVWCGEAIDLTGTDMGSAVEWSRKHDASCEKNPLQADLAEAEALLSEAHVMQWKHDSVYAEWRNRIDAFLARRSET